MFFPFFCIIIVIIIVMFIHHYYYYLQIHYLRALGGGSLGAAVRMMMRKVATNDVWAGFSLKGRKNKEAFQGLNICQMIISKCKGLPNNWRCPVNHTVLHAFCEKFKTAKKPKKTSNN